MVVHDDWQGWLFVLSLDRAGQFTGFEMYGDGPDASNNATQDDRRKGTVLYPAESVPLRASLVRKVPFRELEAAVRRRISGADGVRRSRWLSEELARAEPLTKKAGRWRWTDVELAKLCAEYVTLVDKPDPTPLKTLAARRVFSEKYMRRLIASVRGDLITRVAVGRAGGELTDKAKELLSGNHQAT